MYIFINYLSLPLFNDHIPYEEVFFIGSFVNGILLTHLYRGIIKKFNWFNLPLIRLSINIFAGALLATIAYFIAQSVFDVIVVVIGKYALHLDMHGRNPQDPSFWAFFYLSLINCYFVFMLWSVLYFVFQYFENFQSAKVKTLKAEAQLKDATLQNLRNQINPHFLFNALNSIKSLTIIEPEKARTATTLLSDILRYTLNSEKKQFVLLTNELDVVRDYLELEKIRFGNRLTFNFDVDQTTLKNQIPPLILLTLAENAIKHGISKLKNGGEVKVKSYLQNNQHCIEVINSGSFIKNENENTGIGLANTFQRLTIIYDGKASLTILNTNENEVTATICLPVNVLENQTTTTASATITI